MHSLGSFGSLFKLLILSAFASAVKLPALSKDESSEILHRSDRDNSFLRLEESLEGDLERECIEEICYHEGRDRKIGLNRGRSSPRTPRPPKFGVFAII